MWNELLNELLNDLQLVVFDSLQAPFTREVTPDVDRRTSTEDTAIPHVSLLGLDGIWEPVCRC